MCYFHIQNALKKVFTNGLSTQGAKGYKGEKGSKGEPGEWVRAASTSNDMEINMMATQVHVYLCIYLLYVLVSQFTQLSLFVKLDHFS